MPIYEYRCDQGHTFEVMQRMSDDPLETCRTCERPVQRVFHPVAVHFKGSGFYNTDYGKRRRGRGEDAEGGGGDGDAGKGADGKADGSAQANDSSDSKSSGDSKAAKKDPASRGSDAKTASSSSSSS